MPVDGHPIGRFPGQQLLIRQVTGRQVFNRAVGDGGELAIPAYDPAGDMRGGGNKGDFVTDWGNGQLSDGGIFTRVDLFVLASFHIQQPDGCASGENVQCIQLPAVGRPAVGMPALPPGIVSKIVPFCP